MTLRAWPEPRRPARFAVAGPTSNPNRWPRPEKGPARQLARARPQTAELSWPNSSAADVSVRHFDLPQYSFQRPISDSEVKSTDCQRRSTMVRLFAVTVFALFVTTSAQGMTPAPFPQADTLMTQVAVGCGIGRTRVNGVCVARTT